MGADRAFLDLIKAGNAAFGGVRALAVDQARRWTGVAILQFSRRHDQIMIDCLKQTAVPPSVGIALHDRGGGTQWCSLACWQPRRLIEDRIQDVAKVYRPPPADPLWRRRPRVQCRFRVRRLHIVGRAAHTLGEWFPSRAIVIFVRCDNRTESQPAEITQFFSS